MPLNFSWKLVGLSMLLIAACLSIFFFFFDLKIDLPVFALSSYFMEHRMFVSFTTNVTDELILLLLLGGLALISFSKERQEDSATMQVKYQAMMKAVIINTFILLFSMLFIYGGGFVGILILNLFSILIIYLICFYWKVYRPAGGSGGLN